MGMPGRILDPNGAVMKLYGPDSNAVRTEALFPPGFSYSTDLNTEDAVPSFGPPSEGGHVQLGACPVTQGPQQAAGAAAKADMGIQRAIHMNDFQAWYTLCMRPLQSQCLACAGDRCHTRTHQNCLLICRVDSDPVCQCSHSVQRHQLGISGQVHHSLHGQCRRVHDRARQCHDKHAGQLAMWPA